MAEITINTDGSMRYDKRLYSVKEVAFMLGLSAASLRNKIAPKALRPFPIRPIRVGGSVRFDIQDIEAYLQLQKKAPGAMPTSNEGGADGGCRAVPDLPGEAGAQE